MPPRSDKDVVLSAIAKMAKGIKIGDLPYATLDSAIDVIGGGWKAEILTGTVAMLTDNQVEDLDRLRMRGLPHRGSFWCTKPDSDEGKFPKGTIQAFSEDFKAFMHRLNATEHQEPPPTSLPLGTAVWIPGGTAKTPWSERHVTRFRFYLGVAAIRITAPSGDSVVEVATPRNGGVDEVISRGGFWTWVYKQKLSDNTTMVLHGYRRPGDGWIEGRCFGVGELPYELSCASAELSLPANEAHLVQLRQMITDGGAPKIFAYERLQEIRTWHREGNKPDGRVLLVYYSELSESDRARQGYFKMVTVTRDHVGWKDVVRQHMSALRDNERALESHVRWLRRAIAEWRYRPQDLPWSTGDDVPWIDFCATTADPRGRVERAIDYVRQNAPEAYEGEKTRNALSTLLHPLRHKEITALGLIPPFIQGSAG